MRKILIAAVTALVLASCTLVGPEAPKLHRVTLMYAAAFSNLSSSIYQDINDICESGLPSKNSSDVFLIYSHMPVRYNNYTPTAPALFRVWTDSNGGYHRDTLITYPTTDVSSTKEVMRKVLLDVKELFPAPHYGLIISSHGKGWIPVGYHEDNYIDFFSASKEQTKEICIESVEGSGIDIKDLPEALPMYFDYIIMDSCLMGCIETAYEVRDRCKLLLFSPTEILTDGMMYDTMGPLITNVANPDIKKIATEYYEHYEAMSGQAQSASVTVVDCSKLEPIASACRTLIDKYRQAIEDTNSEKVQAYFYNSLHWFFDLRDIFYQSGATEEDLAELDAALDDAIVYAASTEYFFHLKLERVCGISMYKPYKQLPELNNYYKTLAWNKAVGLIQ